jgi:hypothetical protein
MAARKRNRCHRYALARRHRQKSPLSASLDAPLVQSRLSKLGRGHRVGQRGGVEEPVTRIIVAGIDVALIQ